MYKNHESKHKQYCRDIILGIAKTLNSPKVLTLPSTNFILEEKLLTLGAKVVCYENNKAVYRKQKSSTFYKKETVKKLTLKQANIFDYLTKTPDNYNIMWFDLCGPLTLSTINNLISVVQTAPLNDSLYIALTTLNGREFDAENLVSFYKAKSISDFRRNVFPRTLSYFSKQVNRLCTLEQYYQYTDSSPMNFYLFKLKNN